MTLDAPMTPVERLAVHWLNEAHDDEAEAVLLLNAPMSRLCAADPATLTVEAQRLQEQMIEVLESWLPSHLKIVDA